MNEFYRTLVFCHLIFRLGQNFIKPMLGFMYPIVFILAKPQKIIPVLRGFQRLVEPYVAKK